MPKGQSMPPEELIAHLKKQPFEPFRIRMTDGAAYEIRHPEVILGKIKGVGSLCGAVYGLPTQPAERLGELLPDRWQAARLTNCATPPQAGGSGAKNPPAGPEIKGVGSLCGADQIIGDDNHPTITYTYDIIPRNPKISDQRTHATTLV
jgi:hypothetical protein